jgi:hypothetical protein
MCSDVTYYYSCDHSVTVRCLSLCQRLYNQLLQINNTADNNYSAWGLPFESCQTRTFLLVGPCNACQQLLRSTRPTWRCPRYSWRTLRSLFHAIRIASPMQSGFFPFVTAIQLVHFMMECFLRFPCGADNGWYWDGTMQKFVPRIPYACFQGLVYYIWPTPYSKKIYFSDKLCWLSSVVRTSAFPPAAPITYR